MQALIGPLQELAEFEAIQKEKQKEAGVLQISGCVNSQKTHMMYALGDGCKYRVIACSSESKARQVYEEYHMLDPETYFYPAKDFLFYQADIRSKELQESRMTVVQAILEEKPLTVVVSFDAFMDALPVKGAMKDRVIRIENGQTLDFDEIRKALTENGYDREEQVDGPGQFAIRGGILDIYPLTGELPVRIELWGDEVDSIRSFDTDSQRSVQNLDEAVIYPADELPGRPGKRVSFLEYFPPEDTLVFLDEPTRLVEKGEAVEQEFVEAQAKRVESGYEVSDDEMELYETAEIVKRMNTYYCIGLSALDTHGNGFRFRH